MDAKPAKPEVEYEKERRRTRFCPISALRSRPRGGAPQLSWGRPRTNLASARQWLKLLYADKPGGEAARDLKR
jgi:hypothetical protein